MSDSSHPDVGKIVVDRTTCIGAAVCEALADQTFEIDDENIAVVKPEEGWDGLEDILEAAKACPVLAIHVYDKEGKKIFPEEE